MLRLTITTTIPSRKGNGMIWFVFETEGKDMVDVHNRLLVEGCLIGTKIFTAEDGNGERIVAGREPFIVGKNAVGTIAPCHMTYREAA